MDGDISEYWCHACSQAVNPILEVEAIKCPICLSGFVEEISSAAAEGSDAYAPPTLDGDSDSDRSLNLWAPILLGMLGNRRRRMEEFEMDENDPEDDDSNLPQLLGELESLMRRTRNTAALLQLLRGIRAGILSDSIDSDRDGERTILPQVGSLGDYFVGPGLDVLLQHLAENDPNRYGTPPARKEAVEALPTVKVEEAKEQCSVCLDDFEVGNEAKEMPCKHKFHGECLLPWLVLHSTCPVCRHQLPCEEESKIGSEGGSSENGDDGSDSRQQLLPLPLRWPFSSLLFSSSSAGDENPSSSSSGNGPNAGGD